MKPDLKKVLEFLVQWQKLLAGLFSLLFFLILLRFFHYYLPDFILRRAELLERFLSLRAYVDSYEPFSSVIFVVWYCFSNSIFVPVFILSLAGGLIFGPFMGSLLGLGGLFLSMQLYYWLGRYFGPRFARRFGAEELNLFAGNTNKFNFKSILFCRLNFFIPIHPVNAVCGAYKVPFETYMSATLVGLSSRVVIYSLLGAALVETGHYFLAAVILWICLVAVQSLFGYWHIRLYMKKGKKVLDDHVNADREE